MRLPVHLRCAASILAVAFSAACGSDSTGPGQSSTALAAHFDSIAVAAKLKSETISAYSVRALLASYLEISAAYGATPSSVDVTTHNGVEHWKAYEVLSLPHSGADSTFLFLAYRDANAHTVVIAFFDSTGTISDAGIITNDTLGLDITSGGGSTSLVSASGACAIPSPSLQNPLIAELAVSSCSLAKFRTMVDFTVDAPAAADPALASLHMSLSSINGIRAVDAQSPSNVHTLNQIRALLHAKTGSKRF